MDSADDSVTRHDVDTAMDSADDSLTGQTAHTSLLDDDHFDLFAAVGTTTDSTDLGGADDTAAVHTNNGGITNPLDDLFDFCSLPSLPLQLVPVNERSSGHPDLLIDIGESDPSNLSPETAPSDNRSLEKYPTDNQFLETVPTDNLLGGEITEQVPADKPSKIQSWDKLEQEIDSSWTVVDKGMTDDPFCDDMLFGDGADKRKSSSGQQVPDILADDLLSGTPDLINSHEANMDGVDNDDIFGFLEDADVNNSAWPFKKRDSSYSSQKSAEPGMSEQVNDQLDFSVIQDTDRLDVDAVKQKTSLRKKGSLALRKKPTRSSMKRCVSESEESRFVDSTEPKPVSNGVQDDENDEMFKKPQTKSPARSAVPSLSQINKPRAPPGAFVPSLNQINTSKVLSGSSKKSGGGSSVKKETSRFTDHTNNHLVQADDNNSQSENEMKAKLKPVVRQSSNDTSSSSKPKLVFESQHSGNENIFPKLKPVSTSQKPKPNNASSNGTKPKVHPRTVTKRVSKDQKDSQNQFSAGKCLPSDASLDTKFNELATRIEQVEESTHNKPAVDQSPSDKALTDGILSPTAFKQRHKPRTSSSSSDGARCDATSSHKVSGEQIKTAGRKVSFDESSCKPLQQAELVRPSQKAEIVKPSQQSEVVKPSQESKVVKPSQKAEVVKPSQQANIVKPSQQADVVKPAWKASLTEHQQREVKGDGVDRQPAWVTRKLKCTDDLSRKMLQEQEPEKPAWFKAAQEKKQRAAEIVMAQENRNQENKARKIDEDEEKKPSPWLGERQLRKTPRTKPLTENQDNNSGEMTPQTPQPSNKRVNSSTDNTTLTPDNTHDRLSPLKTTKTEDSTSATSTVKDDYAPSWMRGNKLKSVSTPNLHHVPRVSGESGVGGEIPQWKRELVNRKKIRRESDVQTDANKDESTEDTSPGVIWKSQLKKKRLPSTSKAEVDKTVSKEPEWKRAAEEKRTRFLKSGMIEQK